MSMPRTIEEWQDRYYEQQALHTEATGILGQERDSWKRKAEVAQRENAALREALTKIASRGVEPRIRPTGEKMAAGCATCQHWWDVDETEHHDPDCAFIVARDALAGQPCNQTNSQEPRQGVASTGEAITTGGGNPSGGTEKPSRGHEAHRAGGSVPVPAPFLSRLLDVHQAISDAGKAHVKGRENG